MIETIKQFVNYDPVTGIFTWNERDPSWFKSPGRAKSWNIRFAGRPCFRTVDAQKYHIGSVFGRNYYAHRVAWAIVHGEWPDGEIDHINGDRCDNRILNLRVVSRKVNGQNRGIVSNNTSGVMGVYWDINHKRWYASVKIDNKNVHLGSFKTREEAIAARKAGEIMLGYHPNHGTRDSVPIAV